jgi:TPR repeat protein
VLKPGEAMKMDIPDLTKKAESGSVVAQSVLGTCYLYGRDVEINYKEAFRLLAAAAEQGASRAVVNLGRMFAEGLGIPKNLPEAIRHYRAVERVEIRAQLELARIYSRGLGVPADSKAARKYYSFVVGAGNVVEDSTTAAFVGAVTTNEIDEAKSYLADRGM